MKKRRVLAKVKAVGSIAGSLCTEAFVCGIGRALLPPGVNIIVQGVMLGGSLLLGGLLGDKVGEYCEEKIDETVQEVKDQIDDAKRNIDILLDRDLENEDSDEDKDGA